MTRLAFSGDQHIDARHLTTLAEQEIALMALVHESVRRGCRALVLLGDATHSIRPSADALRIWGRALEQAQRASLRVVAIAGNHERDGVTSLLEYFRGSIIAITEPTPVPIDLYGVDLVALPWLPDQYVRAAGQGALTREEISRRLTQATREILAGFRAQRRPGVPLVLATHATIAGAETSSGFQMGFLAGDHYLVPLEELEGFDFVAAGHIHRHQRIGERGVYTGSLLPLDFAETEPKGFVVAEIGQPAGAFHTATSWELVCVPTPEIQVFDVPQPDVSIAELVTNASNYVDAGAKVRVRVTCDEATAREYSPSRIADALRAAGASLVQVELDVARPDRVRQQVDDELTPARALGRYLETREDLDTSARERVLFHGITTVEQLRASSGAIAGADLELSAIEAHDLLGVHDARVEFDGHGVYAITGPVGVGKSTLGADAPRFALFGASRYGAKVTDMLVRQGADAASAVVELQSVTGDRYRIVRKLKKSSRGVTSTLDVLAHAGDATESDDWRPLTTGKVAEGQAAIAQILGGLDDDTLGVASIVRQREADAFMRARPEERKQLLASAAGLSVFDELTDLTQVRLREAERALELEHAKADPLRVRAATVPFLEAELADAERQAADAAAKVQALEQEREGKRTDYDRADDKADEYDHVLEEARTLTRDLEGVEEELRLWAQKKTYADGIVAEKKALVAARADLEQLRALIGGLETLLVEDTAAAAARSDAIAQRQYREERLNGERQKREQERRGLEHLIAEAKQKGALVDEADCCRTEIGCVFLVDAHRALGGIPDLEAKLAQRDTPSAAELALTQELQELVIPEAPDPAITKGKLTRARARIVELERDVAVAEKIAKAEQVLAEHDEAVAKLRTRETDLRERKGAKNRLLVMFGPDPRAAAERARLAWEISVTTVNDAKRSETECRDRAGQLRGRIGAAREAAAELGELEIRIRIVAGDVGALKVLVLAWRACRVTVLEASVIPSVEDTANEILRRFPYGMQILFATQRERRSGDGVAEALDVEVLGGRAPLYEGCSGGQRTTIDFALHVAIALVVSRRASSRLRFLFCDEPEGLDEPGRAAFAAIARWIHETYGLTVLVASHASDLVDALGGQRIDVVQGPDGSTIQTAAETAEGVGT